MRFDRFVEISAFASIPGHRGKGSATLLVTRLAEQIQAQGCVSAWNKGSDSLLMQFGRCVEF
jgi:predicted GNAT family acetyltransferase